MREIKSREFDKENRMMISMSNQDWCYKYNLNPGDNIIPVIFTKRFTGE